MFIAGFEKRSAAPGVAQMMSKAKSIMPNFMKSKAPPAIANKVKANVTASQTARKASKIGEKSFTSGFGGATNMNDKIKTMPNATQGRIEKSYAKSKGAKVEDHGSQFDRARRKAKAKAPTPAAPETSVSDKAKGLASKIKPHHLAIGAGGMAVGYGLRGAVGDPQQQR